VADVARGRAALRLAAFLLVLLVGVVIVRTTPVGTILSRQGAMDVVEYLRTSSWAPLLFVFLYAGAVALALPGTILTLTGGAVFGFWGGLLLNSIGANIGANLAFFLARRLGRDGIRTLLRNENLQKHMARLDEASREHGFRGVLVLRLVPLVPFNILNFAPGLTAIQWRAYALATVIGILPGTAVYTFFADALLQGSQQASREAFVRALVAGLLLVLLSLIPMILKKLKVSLPGLGVLLALGLMPASHLAGQAPDHARFNRVLEGVVRMPLVDYTSLQENREELDGYIRALAAVDPDALAQRSEHEQLALWINAYNACMLRVVVEHYPIRRGGAGLFGTIRNLFAGYPRNSVWQIRDVFGRSHCPVAGVDRSQDEIEHEIIRPRFGDPRIHFAVNCAARSCPVLWPEAYRAERLDEQLERAVAHFMGNDAHFRIERGTPSTLRLNRVLDWYRDDFGGLEGVKAFFAERLDPAQAAVLRDPDTVVDFFEYDWTLNDVVP
jgi:uncharacterized membrane protein YdjX (TVP38/TMEM64 family)